LSSGISGTSSLLSSVVAFWGVTKNFQGESRETRRAFRGSSRCGHACASESVFTVKVIGASLAREPSEVPCKFILNVCGLFSLVSTKREDGHTNGPGP
jgi:hypothetical protein